MDMLQLAAKRRNRLLLAWRLAVLLLLAVIAATAHQIRRDMVAEAASSWDIKELRRDVEGLSA